MAGRLVTGRAGFRLHAQYGGGVLALRNLDDPNKYQDTRFAAIGIDELTKNPERTFHICAARCAGWH